MFFRRFLAALSCAAAVVTCTLPCGFESLAQDVPKWRFYEDGMLQFREDGSTNEVAIAYTGRFYGVDIYCNDSHKLDLMIPWLELLSSVYSTDGMVLVVYDDSRFSLNRLCIWDEEKQAYILSRNFCFGQLGGLYGEYNADHDYAVISQNLDDQQFQFTVGHEMGHHVNFVYGYPSNDLTYEEIEVIRQTSIMWPMGKNTEPICFSAEEAFAEDINHWLFGIRNEPWQPQEVQPVVQTGGVLYNG